MSSQQDMSNILDLLKTRSMAGLDLSLPVVVKSLGLSSMNNAQSLGEIDILRIYFQFCSPLIGSFDLAGAEKYHFRPPRAGHVFIAITEGDRVKVLERTGRVLFAANPNVFFPIVAIRARTVTKSVSFTQFSEFPREIRHQIWAIAAEPRHLVAQEYHICQWMGESIGFVPDQTFAVDIIRPSVTEVCPEARTVLVAIGVYQVVRYLDRVHGPVKYFILNPHTDTLEINTHLPWFGRSPQFVLGNSRHPTHFADLSAITHLTMALPHLEHSFEWAVDTMAGMNSLEELTLWETHVDPTVEVEYQVQLQFAQVGPWDDELLPIYPRRGKVSMVGIGAMMKLCNQVAHENGEERLFKAWTLISLAFQSSAYCPQSVWLDLRYFPAVQSG